MGHFPLRSVLEHRSSGQDLVVQGSTWQAQLVGLVSGFSPVMFSKDPTHKSSEVLIHPKWVFTYARRIFWPNRNRYLTTNSCTESVCRHHGDIDFVYKASSSDFLRSWHDRSGVALGSVWGRACKRSSNSTKHRTTFLHTFVITAMSPYPGSELSLEQLVHAIVQIVQVSSPNSQPGR